MIRIFLYFIFQITMEAVYVAYFRKFKIYKRYRSSKLWMFKIILQKILKVFFENYDWWNKITRYWMSIIVFFINILQRTFEASTVNVYESFYISSFKGYWSGVFKNIFKDLIAKSLVFFAHRTLEAGNRIF